LAETQTVPPAYFNPQRECVGEACDVPQQPAMECQGLNCLPQAANPTETCRGMNCQSPSGNPAVECQGQNCLPPTDNSVDDCEGEDCTMVPVAE
jgi:hypothetical protein